MQRCAVGFDGAEGGLIAGSDGVVVEERHEVGVRLAVADHPIELRQGADAGRFGDLTIALCQMNRTLLKVDKYVSSDFFMP